MRNYFHLFVSATFALMLIAVSCSPAPDMELTTGTEPVAPLLPDPINSSGLLSQLPTFPTQGETSVPVRSDIEQLLTQLTNGLTADISTLKPASGAEPRYLAVGGSLTAGLRNGGLYREGQLTSYPNLIARQMGLKSFRQPLFELAQGNGSGYKRLLQTDPVPRYADVKNNTAVEGSDPLTLTRYSGEVDHLAFPHLGHSNFRISEEYRVSSTYIPGTPYEPAYRPYFRRLLPDNSQKWSVHLPKYIEEQKLDFCTMELGLDDAIWYAANGGYRLTGMIQTYGNPEGDFVRLTMQRFRFYGIKGVFATIPDVLDFPYFKLYKLETLRQKVGSKKLYVVVDDFYYNTTQEAGKTQSVREVQAGDLLLPTANIDALFLSPKDETLKGFSPSNPLSSRDVLSTNEIEMMGRVNGLNGLYEYQAVENKLPIIDLRAIYKRVIAGEYVSEDGVKIDPSFPNGNFFSQDGLYPSAVGQAVIANEWIKVINQAYKTSIPLVRVQQISQTLNRQ